MHAQSLVDVAGRRRSPATLPRFQSGRPPRNKGLKYPADPPSVEEIVAGMRQPGLQAIDNPRSSTRSTRAAHP
jgi:hypothetical protein